MKVFTGFLLWLSCTLTIVSLILIIALAAQHRNDSLTYFNQLQWFWKPGILFLIGVLTFFWFAMRQGSDR